MYEKISNELDIFSAACKDLERSRNYLPGINGGDLLNLVVDEHGCAKHAPRRSAHAIRNSDINPISNEGISFGKIYQILLADKTCHFGEYPVWNVDNSMVILVDNKGKYSIHNREEAEAGNFSSPIMHININNLLNSQNSLSYLESQKRNIPLEIKTNAQILAQAHRTETGFFAKIPVECLTKIAAFSGGNPNVIAEDEEAYKLACASFGRP